MQVPLEAKSLAPGGNRGEAKTTFIRGGEQEHSVAASLYQASLAKHVANLALIADWRAELTARIDRAQMRFELIGLDLDEHDDIADEVQTFKQLCLALMATRTAAPPTRWRSPPSRYAAS